MASSKATSVQGYLEELPADRREVVAAVRTLVKEALPAGVEEAMAFGMISWQVPLSRYPDTYNRQPLAYISLAAQKQHYALYLMGAYADSEALRIITEAYAAAGRRLDMGKSCLRFRRADELPLDALKHVVGLYDVDHTTYERITGRAPTR
jgi:uncharacterized protein YdhG (YjbR/CyaY superfamily)